MPAVTANGVMDQLGLFQILALATAKFLLPSVNVVLVLVTARQQGTADWTVV